jgi:hypothetical protein
MLDLSSRTARVSGLRRGRSVPLARFNDRRPRRRDADASGSRRRPVEPLSTTDGCHEVAPGIRSQRYGDIIARTAAGGSHARFSASIEEVPSCRTHSGFVPRPAVIRKYSVPAQKCRGNSATASRRAQSRRASPIAQVSGPQTLKRDSVGSHDVCPDRLGRSHQPGVVLAQPTCRATLQECAPSRLRQMQSLNREPLQRRQGGGLIGRSLRAALRW